MTGPVLCAGRLYCDLVFADAPRLPTPGTEVFAPHLSLHAGGGAFITAATLVSLGHEAWQFSVLPAAPFDTQIRSELQKYGVTSDPCKAASAGVDPQITVAIGSGNDRAFLTRIDGPALPALSEIDFNGFAHLHIGELRTLVEHPALIRNARAAGLTISLDCGWQDSFDAQDAELIASVDVFLPNDSEVAALDKAGISSSCAPLTVVKCGAEGARAKRRDDSNWTVRSGLPVQVVDATGAGDAFNAGFLSGWFSGATLDACLAEGNTCGAKAVQATGGAGCLSKVTEPA